MRNDLQIPLPLELTPSEADLRAVFDRTNLPLPFGKAMERPAIARCLAAAARALLASRKRGQGKRRAR